MTTISRRKPGGSEPFLLRFMRQHRLNLAEVSREAGVSRRSLIRLRNWMTQDSSRAPKAATLRRVADALEHLTKIDGDEIFSDLLRSVGRSEEVRQSDLGLRGISELTRHYQAMNPQARHLLMEQARLLAREMPDR